MENPEIAAKHPFVRDEKPGVYYWCLCGRSSNQPFCNGAHKATGFSPIKVELTEDKKVAWCGCKHSANKPFCDGTHKTFL